MGYTQGLLLIYYNSMLENQKSKKDSNNNVPTVPINLS